MSIKFEIISPQEIIFDEEVSMIIFPGIEGDFGILENHMPFLTYLRLGQIYIYKEKKLFNKFIVGGGIVEVLKEKCILLTEDVIASNQFKILDQNNEIENLKQKIVSNSFYN